MIRSGTGRYRAQMGCACVATWARERERAGGWSDREIVCGHVCMCVGGGGVRSGREEVEDDPHDDDAENAENRDNPLGRDVFARGRARAHPVELARLARRAQRPRVPGLALVACAALAACRVGRAREEDRRVAWDRVDARRIVDLRVRRHSLHYACQLVDQQQRPLGLERV